jgi:hypothetical protein
MEIEEHTDTVLLKFALLITTGCEVKDATYPGDRRDCPWLKLKVVMYA